MTAFWLIITGFVLIAVTLLSRLVERLPVSPGVVYLLAGLALGLVLPGAADLHPLLHLEFLGLLSEGALLVVLFTAGLKLRQPFRDRRWLLPLRLATLTALATVFGVALLAWLFFDFSPGLALVLGAALSPTDPALASEVQSPAVGARDNLHSGLIMEGGLSIGTAFPILLLGLGLMGSADPEFGVIHWLTLDVLWSLAGGLTIGFAVGMLVTTALRVVRSWQNEVTFDGFLLLGTVALSYGVAVAANALGLMAVFAAGLALRREAGRTTSTAPRPPDVHHHLERAATVVMVLLVGVMIATGYGSWAGLAIAGLLFTVVRPLSVAAGLAGAQVTPAQRRAFAWFGFRGMSSLYCAVFAVSIGSDQILHAEAEQLLCCVFTVVCASIVLHGLSVGSIADRTAASE